MDRTTKETTVAELKQTLSNVASLVVAEFRGLKVEDANGLRREIRKNDCSYRVVKNTLFKRAIAGTPMEGLAKLFRGPTAIAYSVNDPVSPARVMDKFCTGQEKLKIKGGYLDGKVLDLAGVKALATMKGKDELRAELLATLIAPAQSFVRLLAAPVQNFMLLLSARERALGETK
jgi:large subunit ribosomal protein L10